MDNISLNHIIEGCQRGERSAQRILYDKYNRILMSICYRYSKSEAEDLLQMSFVKIFQNIEKYTGSGSFEGWMKRITVNTAITYYNKKSVLKYSEDISDHNENFSHHSADVISSISADDLVEVINELPDIYRIPFNLYAIEGYKHHEIAEMMDISEGTSKSQVSRARKMIQNKLSTLAEMENSRQL